MKSNETNGKAKKRGLRIYLPVVLVILLVLAGAYYWYKDYSRFITTEDAYVDANRVSVSAKMLGRVTAIYAKEGDTVSKGQLLAELDSTDLLAQKRQSEAMLLQARAAEVQAEARFKFDQESIKLQEINLEKAQEDFNRAREQYQGNVIPKEQFDHIKKALQSAEAQLEAAKAQLKVSKAQVGSAAATVESADAQIGVIVSQLGNTRLYSPSEGIVAKRWMLPGDIAQPGQSIYTIYEDQRYWVIVNLEETKLSGVYLGQDAKFSIDAFPDAEFYGKVYYIGSSTASQFSLIPPNNASGNFTKITQRVPVKISIDSVDGDRKLADYNFMAGMSAVIKIVRN
jgi:membrane fusion protein, multidrug efflux system